MNVLRFVATLCLLVAVIALISDMTPAWSGSGKVTLSALEAHWKQVTPATFQSLEQSISGGRGGWLWSYIIAPLISVPTCILFAVLAALAGYAGRRRTRVKIYAN